MKFDKMNLKGVFRVDKNKEELIFIVKNEKELTYLDEYLKERVFLNSEVSLSPRTRFSLKKSDRPGDQVVKII